MNVMKNFTDELLALMSKYLVKDGLCAGEIIGMLEVFKHKLMHESADIVEENRK